MSKDYSVVKYRISRKRNGRSRKVIREEKMMINKIKNLFSKIFNGIATIVLIILVLVVDGAGGPTDYGE
jgi:hypothetical protein